MTRDNKGHPIGGGVVAGLVSGAVLLLLLAMAYAARGQSFWLAPKLASAAFLRGRALEPGFDGAAVFLGVIVHFAVAVVWGVGYGLLVYGLPRGATLLGGVMWGILVWLGMYNVVLPVIGLGELAWTTPILRSFVVHGLYGLSLALAFLPFQRTRLDLVTSGPPI